MLSLETCIRLIVTWLLAVSITYVYTMFHTEADSMPMLNRAAVMYLLSLGVIVLAYLPFMDRRILLKPILLVISGWLIRHYVEATITIVDYSKYNNIALVSLLYVFGLMAALSAATLLKNIYLRRRYSGA